MKRLKRTLIIAHWSRCLTVFFLLPASGRGSTQARILSHCRDPSRCSDNTGSLILWAMREFWADAYLGCLVRQTKGRNGFLYNCRVLVTKGFWKLTFPAFEIFTIGFIQFWKNFVCISLYLIKVRKFSAIENYFISLISDALPLSQEGEGGSIPFHCLKNSWYEPAYQGSNRI